MTPLQAGLMSEILGHSVTGGLEGEGASPGIRYVAPSGHYRITFSTGPSWACSCAVGLVSEWNPPQKRKSQLSQR